MLNEKNESSVYYESLTAFSYVNQRHTSTSFNPTSPEVLGHTLSCKSQITRTHSYTPTYKIPRGAIFVYLEHLNRYI